MVVFFDREFYTGWLTHWGEKSAQTDAQFTARELQRILSQNASVVLYVWCYLNCSSEMINNREYYFSK